MGAYKMTYAEFLSQMKTHGAYIAPPMPQNNTLIATTNLQQLRVAMLPKFMIELYSQCGGLILDTGYIFGPSEINRGKNYPVPDIVQINRDTAGIPALCGKTIFGRNDLFLFAFDSFGVCQMLDNITLAAMRTYDDPWRAMTDCLIAGKL